MRSALIDRGLAALREGDLPAARLAFESALAEVESGEALEGLAEVLYFEREYSAAARYYERAFVAYRREGHTMGAGRAARTTAWVMGNVLGDWAVGNAWLARARAVFEEVGQEGPERGWALMLTAFTEPDAHVRESLVNDAIALARRVRDPDVESLGRAYLGSLFVMTDRVDEGMALSDEAMAAICAGELTDAATIDEIFCGLFWACEVVNDIDRADQWMRATVERGRRSGVVAAFCRAHYGGILMQAGRWAEAETELAESVRQFDRGASPRRMAALIRLAELRLRQGRIEEAAQFLVGLDQHPDAVHAWASLHLARGETSRAREILEHRTGACDDTVPTAGESIMLGPLLALLLEVYLAEKRIDDAERVGSRLDRLAERQRGPYYQAAAAFARGRIFLAGGQPDARACLRQAMAAFARAHMPWDLARARLELAHASTERAPEVAVAEATEALHEFERLGAAHYADAAGALLRTLGAPIRTGPKGVGALTRREAEILELIAAGLTNVEIASRLYITRKTVEHHVGSVLSKLGLRNRAEAAAYVTRQRIGR